MEERLRIPVAKNKVAYGTLNYRRKSLSKLVVLVHGLLGNENWPPLLQASRYFTESNFAVFRFNLYHWEEGARHFSSTTLSQHSKDLDKILDSLSNRYKSVFVVGHSYGGLTVLQSKLSGVNAVSLWDPSSFIAHPPTYFKLNRKINKYILKGSNDYIVGKKFVEDAKRFPDELELIKGIRCPVQIAYADGPLAVLKKSSKRYFRHANEPKNLLVVKKAGHCFTEEGVDRVLFKGTEKWFKKFI